MDSSRPIVGVWTEWPVEAGWRTEGVARLLAFIVGGIADRGQHALRLVLPRRLRDEAIADLSAGGARMGTDFFLHTPDGDAPDPAQRRADMVEVASGLSDVGGWLALLPHFSGVRALGKPYAVVFADAIPLVFPAFNGDAWKPDGPVPAWRDAVSATLRDARAVVVFSDHVARDQGQALFGVNPARIRVVPHATPDLSGAAPYMTDRRRSRRSLAKAASILREHARTRGWTYLQDFPFEETSFLVASTHDRPSKNLGVIVRALDRLVRRDGEPLKALLTARLLPGAEWTRLPALRAERGLAADVLSMPDLPRDAHAALLHLGAVVVHPTLFEGGHAPFPFGEAVGLGTPCLMARGPHVRELLTMEPTLASFVFHGDDPDGLAALVRATIAEREEVLASQQAAYGRLAVRTWADVAAGYAAAALGSPAGPVATRSMEPSRLRPCFP